MGEHDKPKPPNDPKDDGQGSEPIPAEPKPGKHGKK